MNRTAKIIILLGVILLLPFLLVEGARGVAGGTGRVGHGNVGRANVGGAGGIGNARDVHAVHVSPSGGVVSVNTRPIQRTPTMSRAATAGAVAYRNPNVYVAPQPVYVAPQPTYGQPQYYPQQGSTYYPQ